MVSAACWTLVVPLAASIPSSGLLSDPGTMRHVSRLVVQRTAEERCGMLLSRLHKCPLTNFVCCSCLKHICSRPAHGSCSPAVEGCAVVGPP
ncbi:hypothetical protein COO60DRAFT_1498306 [Scenedesmus sp. NREL 46B-D3]|nr:hypothetical protein COO60DRAFT_1498306 [Scenedesmus sp. NREL 46B-D3]